MTIQLIAETNLVRERKAILRLDLFQTTTIRNNRYIERMCDNTKHLSIMYMAGDAGFIQAQHPSCIGTLSVTE